MASNRHLGRIVALQTLYEYDFRMECDDPALDLAEILNRNLSRYSETIDDKDFISRLVDGVIEKTPELDKKLQPIAPDWPIAQIARVDRLILRVGLYELSFSPEVPPKVVINEAVELAKSFGGDNSSKFVNGVLGTAFKNIDAKEAAKSPKKNKEDTESKEA